MKLREIFETAKANGRWTERQMWQSIDAMDDMLADMKKTDKQAFWDFMREQYGIASGGHYDEVWAMHDVSEMYYTDKEGKKHSGAHWTVDQVEEATKGMAFPSGVTKWDKFVGFNGFYADLNKVLTDEQIIKAAYEFFFMDEDWNEEKPGSSPCKVWEYFSCKYDE